MARGIVHLLKVIQVDEEQSDVRAGAARALDGAGQAILKEAPVGQAGQFVMQRQVPVVFDLVLKQKHDHAHGHNVLGQIPDLVFEAEIGKEVGDARSYHEDARPGEEAGDGDERSRGCPPISEPEMDGTAEVDGEEHGLEGKHCAHAGPLLEDQQEDREAQVEGDDCPAQRMSELTPTEDQNDERQGADEHRYGRQSPGRDRVDDEKSEVECVVRQENGEHPLAGALLLAMGHGRPHKQDAGTSQSGKADERCEAGPVSGGAQEHECSKMSCDQEPAGEPDGRDRFPATPHDRRERDGEEPDGSQIRKFAPINQGTPVVRVRCAALLLICINDRISDFLGKGDSAFVGLFRHQYTLW